MKERGEVPGSRVFVFLTNADVAKLCMLTIKLSMVYLAKVKAFSSL